MLSIENVSAAYGDLKVLFGVSLHIDDGEIVSLVGSNGAGKTTLLQIVSGFVPISRGRVSFNGVDLSTVKTCGRADLGIAHIPQGRGILGTLSVKDNLYVGAYSKKARPNLPANLEKVYELFPILKERGEQLAGSLSGGQQQMLAIGRALMQQPKLLMLDEPSLGLAPIVVEEVFRVIRELSTEGISILIVEQNLFQALSVSNRGYVLETGRVVMEGPAGELIADERIKAAYLGI
ncbi:MAG: ABC transporter ATP-binding protein [Clostridiales bacterium]|nr:ABC transporter ATP-binding protein [Clostridiales bacterium]